MKLKHILLFTTCIAFFACSTDSLNPKNETNDPTQIIIDDSAEIITNDLTLIKRIVYNIDTLDEYTYTFKYNDNKLTSVSYDDYNKNVYTYDDNDFLIKDECFKEGKLVASVELKYNSEGEIAEYFETISESSRLDDRQYKKVFTYNNDRTVTKKVYANSSDDSGYELSWIETITLEEKNITKISDKTDDSDDNRFYIYDDKNGAYKNIHAIEVLNFLSENEFGATIYGNTNNIANYHGSVNGSGSIFKEKFMYTYNEENYPKTCKHSTKYDDLDEVETLEYFYE